MNKRQRKKQRQKSLMEAEAQAAIAKISMRYVRKSVAKLELKRTCVALPVWGATSLVRGH